MPSHEEAGGDGADAEAEHRGAELAEQGFEEGDDGGGDLLGKARGVDLDLGRWVGLGVGRCCALSGDSVVHCGLGRVLDGEEAEGVARERDLALLPLAVGAGRFVTLARVQRGAPAGKRRDGRRGGRLHRVRALGHQHGGESRREDRTQRDAPVYVAI